MGVARTKAKVGEIVHLYDNDSEGRPWLASVVQVSRTFHFDQARAEFFALPTQEKDGQRFARWLAKRGLVTVLVADYVWFFDDYR